MAKLRFDDIIDIYKGKIGIAVATGSCLKPHLNNIIELSHGNKHIIVSVNECDTMFPKLKVSYRVVANSYLTITREHLRFNKEPQIPLIYADSVDLTPKNIVDQILTVDYIPYDQRHFGGRHCTWGSGLGGRNTCCNNIEEGRLTIQEELKKYCKTDLRYGAGDTVALHMLAVTILIGLNPIYLVGTDLDYSKGYADGVSQNHDSFAPYVDRILKDMEIIKKSADNIGVKIYSLCEGSPVNNIFEYKDSIDA
jgi:hypothetical protein